MRRFSRTGETKKSRRIKLLLLVTLLAGSLAACTMVKGAPKSGSTAVPRTTTVPGETVEPSRTGLRATIEVPAALLTGEAVNLRFTLTNNSDKSLYALKWYTPLEGLAGEIFYIECDGQVIPYQGILASRDKPSSEAYVLLDAGKSVSAEVDLATAYDFSEAGAYTIEFLSPSISHIARSEAEMAKTVDDLGPVQIPSNRVTVEIGQGTIAAPPTATLAATATATAPATITGTETATLTAMATSTATAAPSLAVASTVAPTATPAPFRFEATTYRDERAGFEFDHPRSWNVCLQEEQSRGYVVNLCAAPPKPDLSISVSLWEPHKLDGYAAQREHAWTSSGSIVSHKMDWMLDGDRRAIRYLVLGREGEQSLVLITTVGERYLVLAGDGDRDTLVAIWARLRFFEPTAERVPGHEMTASPDNDRTRARQALETYFALLHDGRYTEAVAYYGGDYQVLRDSHPDVASDDYARLLERACRPHGGQCMALQEIVVHVEQSPAEHHFVVRFVDHDGSTYARPLLCCGGSSEPSTDQFAYTVLKVKDRLLVQELPVYIP